MYTAREYREFAAQCIKWATEAEAGDAERAFITLADDWGGWQPASHPAARLRDRRPYARFLAREPDFPWARPLLEPRLCIPST
jgi:hypothetical protein